MKRYEYALIHVSPPTPDELSKFGKDGWLMVQIINSRNVIGALEALFVRELPDEKEDV